MFDAFHASISPVYLEGGRRYLGGKAGRWTRLNDGKDLRITSNILAELRQDISNSLRVLGVTA
jgi:hypothetical protein